MYGKLIPTAPNGEDMPQCHSALLACFGVKLHSDVMQQCSSAALGGEREELGTANSVAVWTCQSFLSLISSCKDEKEMKHVGSLASIKRDTMEGR